MQLLSSWFVLLLLASVGLASRDGGEESHWSEAREHTWSKARANTKYIVVLKPNSSGLLGQIIGSILGKTLDGLAQFTLGAFSGFNAELTKEQLEILKKNPSIAYVEEDGLFKTMGVISKAAYLPKRAALTQSPSSWGLERISQKTVAQAPFRYSYDSTAGAGTCIYVIDSGVYAGHNEFGGRVTFVQNYVYGEGQDDQSGHGTAVAGAAAGAQFGAAKAASIYSIKVCNQAGNCDVSSVVAAIARATNDAKGRQCPNGVVLNLSLGGPSAGWQSVRDAVVAAAQAGAFVVAAAGNDHANVNNYLPASAAGACSVGATDQNDVIWPNSNIGSSLAVFAPGVGVQTAALGNADATAFVDGTSVSAPFVAGLGAYLWAKDGKGSGAAGVALCTKIKNTANTNVVGGNLGGSPNRLAWNGMQ